MGKRDEKKEALFAEMKKLAKRANQRLVRLERAVDFKPWAVRNLEKRLERANALTKSNRIKYNKSMSITDMRKVIKATNLFLNSKTSTPAGLKKRKQEVQKNFARVLDVSMEEADNLYQLFEVSYIEEILRYLTPSELFALIEEAKEKNLNEQQFIKLFEQYVKFTNDNTLKNAVIRLYREEIGNVEPAPEEEM